MNIALMLQALGCLAVTLSAQDIQKEAWDRVPPYADSLFKTHLDFNNDAAWTLRLGGHARTMLEAYRNPDFGFSEIKQDAWVHHRVQTFAAVERGRNFTLAAEVTWGEMEGRKPPLSPVDEDQLDLLQLYAQARFDIGDAELALRAGRQALYYGSGRLLAVREGANQRLSQDALRLSWRQDDWNVDGILASPVKIQPHAFDNTSHFDQTMLWGLYATGPSIFGKGHGVDFYYLGLRQENAPLSPGMTEQRHTFGSRWFGKTQNWNYNHEFILQTGDSGGKDILAGAVSLSAGRSFKSAPLKPTLGFKADVISGGQNGMSMHTFNPLFQANNYFNEGGFVSPSNARSGALPHAQP